VLGHESNHVSRKEGKGVNWEEQRKIERPLLSIAVFAYPGLNCVMMAQNTFFLK